MDDDFADLQREAELLREAQLIAARPHVFERDLERLWDEGLPGGYKTGWPTLDAHYTVAPGQLTILTGWPGSGKSEWLDALLLNLARQGWRHALHSPENKPEEIHVAKYVEKFIGKPFGAGPNPRLSKEEMREAMIEMRDWFGFLVAASDSQREVFGIEQIMEAAESFYRSIKAWHSRENPCGLVIDPWNELEHLRPKQWSETEYISATLTGLRAWARKHRIHVWLVAHPQKLRRDDQGNLPVPRPDSISGSQHWWNKADNAITVWREFNPMPGTAHEVKIFIQKVRFKHIGRIGEIMLHYDRITGRYSEPDAALRAVK